MLEKRQLTTEPVARATLEEVARTAGVSRSTAGRALSGHPAVSESSRARVIAAAKALGYRTDPAARALRGGTSRLIGLVVTNLVNSSIQTIVARVHSLAYDHGFQVLMAVTDGDGAREHDIIQALADHRVQGLMVMPSGGATSVLQDLHSRGTAVVTMIRTVPDRALSSVVNDDRAGAFDATRHLLELGHRRIAFIGGPAAVHSGRARLEGYRQALHRAGIEMSAALVQRGPFEPEWGSHATRELLFGRCSFSALLVANHEALFGVLQTLAQQRVQIPGTLSLVGFEDAPLFRYWHPAVTVVDTNPALLAEVAFASLLEQLGNRPRAACVAVRVPASLVVRSSTTVLSADRAPARVGSAQRSRIR